jgi:hypothetical protein
VLEITDSQLVLLRFLMGLSLTGGSSASHHRTAFKEKPMPELTHIDPRSAALLVMDYQVDALTRFMTAAQSADAGALRGRSS